jgi:acyl-CoA synthetase (AMP-forming)/AMP-acid ligase II
MMQSTLDERLARRGERTFVVTDGGTYTYARIREYSLQFTTVLRKHGIGKGDTIAILAGNSAAYVAAWFGAAMAGAITATLNNQLLADSLCYTVRQSGCRLIVADREWVERAYHHLPDDLKALPIVTFENEAGFFAQLADEPLAEPDNVASSDPFTILYTSGTTGLPKGVVNSQGAYFASGEKAAALLNMTAEDRLMVFLPMFHVNPQMMGFMSALAVGASIALRPRFSASSFFDDAKRFGATGCTYVGTIFSILANRFPGEQRDHGMKFCFGAGAHGDVWTAVEERFGMAVHEVYGMTELGGWTTGSPRDQRRYGSCGKARDDIEVMIVDEFDNPVPPGVKGEIVGRPRMPDRILMEYWRQPDKTLEATRNLWFHSGDLGSRDDDGYFYYHGRLKELIRRGGEMISPIEIETRLMDLSGVRDCAIVGVPDEIMDEEIKAVIVADSDIDPRAVPAFLREYFPRYMLPRYVEFTDRIPKTANQKVQRHLMRENGPAVCDLRDRG